MWFSIYSGQGFIDIYSPTIQVDSLRLTTATVSPNSWNIKQLDFRAAYLNTDLDKEIYLDFPTGNIDSKKNKYWSYKALYGLKQTGEMWFKEIVNFLISRSFKKYKIDKCLLGKYNKNNKLICILTLYVDDILITGKQITKLIILLVN